MGRVHTFELIQGLSARNGIISVELVRKGFTGLKDPSMSKQGYFAQYCRSYRPELLTAELGKKFYAESGHKLYPGCYGRHVAIECCLELLRQHDINPQDIDEVILRVPPGTYGSFLNQPFEMGDSQIKASFNLPYNVANALLRKRVALEHFTDEFLRDLRVIDLAKKVKIVSRTATTTPERFWVPKAWSTDLTVGIISIT